MRTETEIRREVESRLRRRGLFILNGGAWVTAVFFLLQFFRYNSFGSPLNSLVVLFMLGWTAVLGLHTLRTIYVELREWLVTRAIEREREFYRMRDAYEKPKHDEALPPLTDDDELIDFPAMAKADHERRS